MRNVSTLFNVQGLYKLLLKRKITIKFTNFLLNYLALGRLAFKLSVLSKRFSLTLGGFSQRAVEYPWVIENVKKLCPKGARILDVGCAESLLAYELISLGYEVWGIDINDYPFKPKRMIFVKRDIRDTGLPSNFFDAVVCVSTLEHIGLPVYGQENLDLEGDYKAMREIWRILKPGGYLFLTTPFAGKNMRRVPGERQYNLERLKRLTQGFEIVVAKYFIPIQKGKRTLWVEIPEDIAGKILTNPARPGLCCLVLRKLC